MPDCWRLLITIVFTVAVCLTFGLTGRLGLRPGGTIARRWTRRATRLCMSHWTWLDSHGVSVAGLCADIVNVAWLCVRLSTSRAASKPPHFLVDRADLLLLGLL